MQDKPRDEVGVDISFSIPGNDAGLRLFIVNALLVKVPVLNPVSISLLKVLILLHKYFYRFFLHVIQDNLSD